MQWLFRQFFNWFEDRNLQMEAIKRIPPALCAVPNT